MTSKYQWQCDFHSVAPSYAKAIYPKYHIYATFEWSLKYEMEERLDFVLFRQFIIEIEEMPFTF